MGEPCCSSGSACNPGIGCVAGTCSTTCGGDGADCSSTSPCCSGFACVHDKCCVTDGKQECCGNYCDETYTCSNVPGPGIHHFAPETLIIPMDSTLQSVDGAVLKAYGLVYRLLQEGIVVHWIIDPNKTEPTAGDFTLDSSKNVGSYGWADSPPVRTALSGSFSYLGGPFIVSEPGDVIKVKRMLDPAYNWQWRADFTSVVVHSVMTEFDAPVSKAMNRPPGKIAIVEAQNGFLKSYLDQAFGNASGVYDIIPSVAALGDGSFFLDPTKYDAVWASMIDLDDAATAKIAAFVDFGKTYLAESDAIDSTEATAHGHFLATNGLDCPSGAGPCDPNPGIERAADPIAQIGDSEFHPQGGCSCWRPLATSAWRPAFGSPADRVTHYLQNPSGYDSFDGYQKDGDPLKGWIFYLGGHSSQGQSANHVCAKRLITERAR